MTDREHGKINAPPSRKSRAEDAPPWKTSINGTSSPRVAFVAGNVSQKKRDKPPEVIFTLTRSSGASDRVATQVTAAGARVEAAAAPQHSTPAAADAAMRRRRSTMLAEG